MKRTLLSFVSAAIGLCACAQQPGTLDLTFDTDGKVTRDINGNSEAAADILALNTGKIVVVGTTKAGTNQNIFLSRFLSNGQADSSFGINGVVVTDLGTNEVISRVKEQPDHKLVLVGSSTIGADGQWLIGRYWPDGAIDSSFGTNGFTTLDFGSQGDGANNLDFLPNGQIMVCGYRRYAQYQVALARLNSNGTLDSTFAQGGTFIWTKPQPHTTASQVNVLPDGRLLLLGGSQTNNESVDFLLMRFTADGVIDSSFGVNGVRITDWGPYDDDSPAVLVIDSANRLIVAGTHYPNYGDGQPAMTRYSFDGAPDSSFGTNGKLLQPMSGYQASTFYDMTRQPDGKLLLCGIARQNLTYFFYVTRLKENAAVDSTWNGNGRTFTTFSYNPFAYTLALQTDGRLLVAGEDRNGTVGDIAIARYNTGLPAGCSTTIANASANQAVCTGTNVQFSITSNAGNLQWQDSTAAGWQDIAGANAAILQLGSVTNAYNGRAYRCIATDACTVVSAPLYLQVANTLLTNQTAHLCPGESLVFKGQTITAAGMYYDSLQSVNGCDSVVALEVFNENAPAIILTPDSAILCLGDSINLSATGAQQYQWSTGESSASISVIPTIGSLYQVTATGANNCSASAVIPVQVNMPPAIPVINRTGDTLITTTGYSCQWFEQGTVLSGETAQQYHIAHDGNYQVQITDSNGCKSLSAVYAVLGLGLKEKDINTGWVVYPVPANESVVVAFTENITGSLHVIDLCGRIIEVWQQTENQQLHSVSSLPNGVYVLTQGGMNKPLAKICVAH
ncbi:MAG: T9SS type A sorting domain-containing protein [Chitinophagales bacterium]